MLMDTLKLAPAPPSKCPVADFVDEKNSSVFDMFVNKEDSRDTNKKFNNRNDDYRQEYNANRSFIKKDFSNVNKMKNQNIPYENVNSKVANS